MVFSKLYYFILFFCDPIAAFSPSISCIAGIPHLKLRRNILAIVTARR
ncbi:hypothetical protein yrohd0001_3110 [Yersinia rohdei ATCC 43380]|nr:hypothetical protein yrohd0001_3110 [Yersinia rohdei ATCC 43380]